MIMMLELCVRADLRCEQGNYLCGMRDCLRDLSRDNRSPDLNLGLSE